MKKVYMLLIVTLLVVTMINPALAANKFGAKFGAKAHGMGGAYTAITEDSTAVYWNPASLTQAGFLGVQVGASGQLDPEILTLITSLQEGDISGLSSFDGGNINVNGMATANLTKFGVGVIANNKVSVDENTLEATNTLTGQGIVSYGTELINPPILGSIAIGANGKILYTKQDNVTANGEVNEGDPKQGYGADVGALVTLSDIDIVNVKAGATVKNVIATLDDPAFNKVTTVGVGATFKFPLINILSARAAADLEILENGNQIQHIGAEGTVGPFSVRAGAYGTDVTKKEARVLTGGLGLNLPFIDLNLAADTEKEVNFSGTFNF